MKRNADSTPARRLLCLSLAIVAAFAVFAVVLFRIQIVDGDYYAQKANSNTTTVIGVSASRGEILDCNLVPIAVNRTTYAIMFDYNYFPKGTSDEAQKEQNDCLLRLVALLTETGEAWNDELPISDTAPYTFTDDNRADTLRSKLRMGSYATADNCMEEMVRSYKLEGYPAAQQRILAGIRYGMVVKEFAVRNPYVFAGDISRSTMYRIVENNAAYPGVDIETVPVRDYVGGDIASHLIGTVGPIYAEDYKELKEKGYAMNDVVGKGGIEGSFEDKLRGTAGVRTLLKDKSGNVLDEEETTAPKPGDTVVMTIDSNLQKAAQAALAEKVAELRQKSSATTNGHDVKSGAAVVLDVKNGGVLTCASWPSYDLATYKENYNTLLADPDNPLFNRALNGAFPCGSTMKPGIALAALTEGTITPSSTVYCGRIYRFYDDYQPHCMGTHGTINVVTAITKSCNIFFYDVGRRMGADMMLNYHKLYGFGSPTGVEIGESSGRLVTPESVKKDGGIWTAGDNLRLAIGQNGLYTPIQLAAYAMMIANDGVRYKTHLVHSIRSYDGTSEQVVEPEIAATVSWSKTAMDTVRQGMVNVVKSGTAYSAFGTAGYSVAAKTGTAQTGRKGQSDHGVFIAYAPVENPEIAVAVVMENGTSSAAAQVARKLTDAYFASSVTGEKPTAEETLLP